MVTDLALARGTDSLVLAWANAVNNMASVWENGLGPMSLGWGNGKGRLVLGWAREIMDLGLVNGMDSSSGLVLGREISRG